MKSPARTLLLSAVSISMAPLYLALDLAGRLPVSFRDRPWPFALVALALSLLAWRASPRLRPWVVLVTVCTLGALAVAAQLRYRLPPSSSEVGAEEGIGAPLPDLILPDESGRAVSLRAPDQRPLLVIWFRGSWCPYCRQQLAEVAADLAHFSPSDLRVLAVSPDPPEPLEALKRELRLPFPLLSDPNRNFVNRCQLTHCVAIIDRHGVVRWGVVSGNWQRDLPARALLQATYRR